MNVIAVLNTGNDSDIIELNIRHNLNYLSKIVVIDNNSVDGTKNILEKLSLEFPNRLFVTNTISNTTLEHLFITNFIKQQILDFDNPDYLLVIDADEFIKCEDLSELNSIPENHVGIIKWKCYIPNQLDHKNFPEEMIYRRDHEPDGCHKVIMPRGVEGSLTLGNHYLHQGEDGHRAAMYELKTIFLAHYPVRSITQINKKIEFISNLFKDLDKELAHQTRTYEKIETLENLIDKAIVYSTNDSETKHKFKVVLDPLINKNNNG